MAPPLPRVHPTGSGSISDSEFKRYVDALGQIGQQQPQQPTPPMMQPTPPMGPMGSGSTTDMERTAHQRYINTLSRLRAAEKQPDRPIGSPSTTDSEFQRYTAPPMASYPVDDFTSGLPPEFSEATAAKNEYEKLRHYNRVMGRPHSAAGAALTAYEEATLPPPIGDTREFLKSLRRKIP